MNIGGSDRTAAEGEGGKWQPPAWSKIFASHGGRDLEQDVTDIEDGENNVVIISDQFKIFLEASETGITYDRPMSEVCYLA